MVQRAGDTPQAQQNANQLSPTLAQVINAAIERSISHLHFAMPGRVEAFYGDEGTADIQPLFKRFYYATQSELAYKPIARVPVVYPGPAGGWLRYPLSKGDPVLLLFAERSLDQWWLLADQADPGDVRMLNLSDAICIPGLRAKSQAIVPNGDPTSLELAFGTAWLEITAGGKFKLKNGVQDVKTVLQDLLAVVANASAPPGAGGGPLIFLPPHDPATVSGEILDLFA